MVDKSIPIASAGTTFHSSTESCATCACAETKHMIIHSFKAPLVIGGIAFKFFCMVERCVSKLATFWQTQIFGSM